ncbi:MAG: hypothetical protein AAGC74_08125 [Verrucomicrobiota bacterium]
MLLARKKKNKSASVEVRELSALVEQERAVAEQIKKMEEMISTAPDRIRKEYEEQRSLMPPPDDWEDRQRTKRFNAQLTRGQIKNAHRHQANSTVLFVLLVVAICSLLSWIISFLQMLG